jgi:hypothetical protein
LPRFLAFALESGSRVPRRRRHHRPRHPGVGRRLQFRPKHRGAGRRISFVHGRSRAQCQPSAADPEPDLRARHGAGRPHDAGHRADRMGGGLNRRGGGNRGRRSCAVLDLGVIAENALLLLGMVVGLIALKTAIIFGLYSCSFCFPSCRSAGFAVAGLSMSIKKPTALVAPNAHSSIFLIVSVTPAISVPPVRWRTGCKF